MPDLTSSSTARLVESRIRVLTELAMALVVYAAISVVVTWPLAAHLSTTVIGDRAGDMGGGVGWLWTLNHEGGFSIFGTTDHWLTGAPLGWEQGNAINLQWLVPYFPAYVMSVVAGEVTAFNVTILSGLTLSAVAMYALARRLGCSPAVAGWSGLVFMIFPWLVWRVNVGHASLTHLEALPLLFIALHAWTRSAARATTMLVCLATAAAWLTSGYFGAMAVIGSLAFIAAAAPVRARDCGVARAATDALVLSAAVIGTTLAIGLASLPGRAHGGITNPRSADNLSVFGARPGEYLAPDDANPFLGWLAQHGQHGSNLSETALFVGWLTIVLALVCLIRALRRWRISDASTTATTVGILAACVAALAFSAPSPVGIAGRLFTWMPSWWLFQVLAEIRVPSRFVALVAATLIPLAALGLQSVVDWARARAGTPERARYASLATVAVAVVISTIELFPTVPSPVRADRLPEAYRAVGRTPVGVLAEYSLIEASNYRFWQRLHSRPLLNGARQGTAADDMRRGLVDPGAPGTAAALALLGVTAIVTRADALDFTEGVPDVPDASWGPGYELVSRFPDGSSVWRVVAARAPAIAILRSPEFGEPQKPRGNFIGRPLRGAGTIELRSRSARTVRLSFEVDPMGEPGTFRIEGADGAVRIPVPRRTLASLVVALPRGISRLTFVSDAPRERPAELSAPRVSGTRLAPRITAAPADDDPGF